MPRKPKQTTQGKRPAGRPRVGPVIEAAIKALREGGMGMHQIAQSLRVGVSVVQRVDAELRRERERQQAEVAAVGKRTAAIVADWEKETQESGW